MVFIHLENLHIAPLPEITSEALRALLLPWRTEIAVLLADLPFVFCCSLRVLYKSRTSSSWHLCWMSLFLSSALSWCQRVSWHSRSQIRQDRLLVLWTWTSLASMVVLTSISRYRNFNEVWPAYRVLTKCLLKRTATWLYNVQTNMKEWSPNTHF